MQFPLVGDATKAISESYGVLGRIIPGNKRVTYVIDEGGRVAAVFHHELQVLRHLDDVNAFLQKRSRPKTH